VQQAYRIIDARRLFTSSVHGPFTKAMPCTAQENEPKFKMNPE